jgi:hypothetical protein
MSFRTCSARIAGILAAAACVADASSPGTDIDFTETFDDGTTDVGHWGLTTNPLRSRVVEPTGGDPGGYLYGEVSTPTPTWSTASTRYQPGIGDQVDQDNIFVGNYYARHINHVSADLRIYQVGSWTPGRTVTLHLVRWTGESNSVAFEAFYSPLDVPSAPTGWHHYDFRVDARSARVPPGWTFRRGDGKPGTDADWATFMHQIDFVGIGYWKPGYFYPALGIWKLGIDNIHVGT